MKKRVLSILLAVLMIAMVFVLTACIPDPSHPPHEWSEWETIKEADCQTPGIAERFCDCGETQQKNIPVVAHKYGDWKETKAPTCEEKGEESRSCIYCDKTETRETSALGHDKVQHDRKDATCAEAGYEAYETCTRCDYTTYEEIPITNEHIYGEWIDEVPPTTEKEGTLGHYHCSVCEKNFDADKKEFDSIVIPKLDDESPDPTPDPKPHEHTESDWIVDEEATCTEEGSKHKECTDCGETTKTEPIPADLTKHVESDWIIDEEATCSRKGFKHTECTNCEAQVRFAIISINPEAHTYDNEYDAFCNECGYEREVDTSVCAHTDTVVIEGYDATCTEAGLTDGVKCANEKCGYIITKQEPIPATDHTPVVDKAVAPTCTETGLTEGSHCDVCGEIIIAQEIIHVISHTYDNEYDAFCNGCGLERETPCAHTNTVVIEGYDATCTETGLTDGVKCANEKCGYIITEQKTIPATGHSFFTLKWLKDEEYHWHGATCGHNDAVSDKVIHNFDSNGECIVCEYQKKIKLETPAITGVLYDVVSWNKVENAKNYTITVNEDYTYTTSSSSTFISNAVYEGGYITTPGTVRIVVRANGDGTCYITSDDSSVFYYYYVPEKTSLSTDESKLYDYGIGYGYNLLENDPIDPEQISDFRVLNLYKLLSIGEYYNPQISKGDFDSTRFSSIEELQLHLDASLDKGKGLNLPSLGSLKKQLTLSGGIDYTKYDFNETYTVRQDYFHKAYELKNYDVDLLEYCFTETFVNDIMLAQSMGEEEWLEYMCSRYGTHAILGVVTGAYYNASYTISTDKTDVAARIKFEFGKNTSLSITDILGLDLGLDISLDADGNWSKEETNASFKIDWRGSDGGSTTGPHGLDSALARFEAGTSSNAVAIRFTDNGAISIGTLISMVDDGLGQKFENYINSKADEEYKALYSKYTKPSTLPLTIENINGQNVLTVDLSKYQSSGSIDIVYNTNLLNGVLTVYPKMMGKTVDKIVITGGLSEYPDSLINGFSIKLANGWNKDIDIVVDNLGVISSYDKGLVDRSGVSSVYVIGLEYTGANLIKYGDKVLFCTSSNDKIYNFDLMLGNNEKLDTSTVDFSSNIRLPIATKEGGYQFAGWYDTNNVAATDNKGYISEHYILDDAIAQLHPQFIKASEGLEYALNDDFASYSIVGIGNCTDAHITIPNTYNGLPITIIGERAFYGLDSLISISIPNSVSSISSNAFGMCDGLTSIDIPDNIVFIGNEAFYGCSNLKDIYITDVEAWLNIDTNGYGNVNSYGTLHILDSEGNEITDITIPDSITAVPNCTFKNAKNITSVTIHDSVTSIGVGAFCSCDNLTNISVSENNQHYKFIDGNLYSKDGKTLVQYINNKKDTSFNVPDSVTSIGAGAFYGCSNLTSVTIPDTVTSIGCSAFDDCTTLNMVYYNGTLEQWNKITKESFWDNDIKSYTLYCTDAVILAHGKTVLKFSLNSDNASYYLEKAITSATFVTVPETFNNLPVTRIGISAFEGCTTIEYVSLSKNIKIIDKNAFSYCTSLRDLRGYSRFEIIGDGAFAGCRAITTFFISPSVTSIGAYAFEGCSALQQVIISDSITSFSYGTFRECRSLTSIQFNGPREQWISIIKNSQHTAWNEYTGEYTVFFSTDEEPFTKEEESQLY